MYLEIKNLTVDLGDFILKNINFSIHEGEYVILIGPTGSGKSVLLETIIGFYSPNKGEIKLNGNIINNLHPEDRGIGIVYQDNILFPNMDVYENIAYGAKKKFSDEEIDEKIKDIAKKMKISHILHRDINTLSGGEAQRTSLARALIVEPKIILMDEPFSALDITTQGKLTSMIKHIVKDYKTTVIHITHNFNEVWNLADRVGVMKDGKVQQLASVHEVFSKPENNFVADFVGVRNIFEGKVVDADSEKIIVKLDSGSLITSSDTECTGKIKEKGIEKILIAVRPENIIFSNEKFESSAKNQLKGKIVDIKETGPTVLVSVDVGGDIFRGLLTKSSADVLKVKLNKEIYISFKSLNVTILDKYNYKKIKN
ncbi:molybdenum ABC transporter, ATPase component [Methanobrevibacter arboriphilus JCM 13429 = DSM 1125]|uniref:Molybdate/tungstate import ATP-binding protein WtpC n=1 Tax=Methanobrevibacter arboriphilus JCM 13429 = DSM 1125 TaxID=1300164 RepID=A0A1V6N4B3_METAZ|nr:ATP-binding cassette domain-containing protein [Methanobrevibacter arboriphilus]OQD59514.1 molybdenum ABC transporter, ATPase component [Methanobrevibacter arboriphilus JCM 13429 = DSM 1125]